MPLSLFTMFTVTLVINNLHNEIISGNKYEGKDLVVVPTDDDQD